MEPTSPFTGKYPHRSGGSGQKISWRTHTPLLIYHLVFNTKARLPLITANLRDALYDYIGDIIRGENGVLIAIGGTQDHINLAAKFKRWGVKSAVDCYSVI